MEFLAILFIVVGLFVLYLFFRIQQKQEDIYDLLKNSNDVNLIEGKLFEGLKIVKKNTWCYITIHDNCIQIILKENTSKKYNIPLNKITNFEVMANKANTTSKENADIINYFLIIQFINKNNDTDIISFIIDRVEYPLVEYVNNIIKKDNAIML